MADHHHAPPLPLELDDDWSNALDDVKIGLPAHSRVAVPQLVRLATLELLGVVFLNVAATYGLESPRAKLVQERRVEASVALEQILCGGLVHRGGARQKKHLLRSRDQLLIVDLEDVLKRA